MNRSTAHYLSQFLEPIADFPQPGIVFRDISPLLRNPAAKETCFREMQRQLELAGIGFDLVAMIDARGFIFGEPISQWGRKGSVMVRKAGKIPVRKYAELVRESYGLEYGASAIEMPDYAIEVGQRVLIVDDGLATGGTAAATAKIVERLGGIVAGFLFLFEIESCGGRQALDGYKVISLVTFP